MNHYTYTILINGEKRELMFVDPKDSNPSMGLVSCEAPLASAVVQLDVGEKTTLILGNGTTKVVQLVLKSEKNTICTNR